MSHDAVVMIDAALLIVLFAGLLLNAVVLAMSIGDFAVLLDRGINGGKRVIAQGNIRRKVVRAMILVEAMAIIVLSWGEDPGALVSMLRVLVAVALCADASLDYVDRRNLVPYLRNYHQTE